MVASLIDTSPVSSPAFPSVAAQMGALQRRDLALAVLGGQEPVTHLAAQAQVSRKFCYQQADKADRAIDQAFAPQPADDAVLFHLPVTQDWIKQLVLAQVLIGHTSYRGVIDILAATFDYHSISLGTIHNIVMDAVDKARQINHAQNLSGIVVGAHDEIFQADQPVLVCVDVDSTYVYLLRAEDQRDETTWGYHLLNLREQGLNPRHTIADGGVGLRAGQTAAWPGTPCHADVFHAERELGRLTIFLDNRAAACTKAAETLERKLDRSRQPDTKASLSSQLASARAEQAKAIPLAKDIGLLSQWMQKDILAAAGPCLATRRELFDYIVEQLRQREALCPHRIKPVRSMLESHRDNLLGFVGLLDDRLAEISLRFGLAENLLHTVCELQGMDRNFCTYWQRRARLQEKLGRHFHEVHSAVEQAIAQTPRASSLVENTNSRLRNYFFLRRQIGNDYLDLLQFYLNHHCYLRSDHPERRGRSPAELLNGRPHPHWLELLGYRRFRRH
jgi:hypothetical protein